MFWLCAALAVTQPLSETEAQLGAPPQGGAGRPGLAEVSSAFTSEKLCSLFFFLHAWKSTQGATSPPGSQKSTLHRVWGKAQRGRRPCRPPPSPCPPTGCRAEAKAGEQEEVGVAASLRAAGQSRPPALAAAPAPP